MAVTLLIISALVFFIIKLPPGDFLSNQIAELRAQGEAASAEKAAFLIKQYGLDRPVWEQYLVWIGVMPGPNGFSGLLQGDWGWSFEFDKPVKDVIGDALWLTLLVNLAVVIFIHLVSIPIAIYSATRQYSIGDYIATLIGYLGLAVPSFLLALILLYYVNRWFGVSIGGLYDPQYSGQPWSWAKIQSLLSHLIVPTLVIGLAGTASMIRRMRANLLDELGKQYYVTAKAKGLAPRTALLKYPFRMSLNPFIADIGNLLPHLVSGSVLVSLVLSLPTVGPILLSALRSQDQFLAGFILMFVALLTVIGMLVSDLLLALLDPRIRMGGRTAMSPTDLPLALLRASAGRDTLSQDVRTGPSTARVAPGAATERRRERELLQGLVLAVDVVEIPPPQGGRRIRLHPARVLSGCAVRGSDRPLQPVQAPRGLPVCAASGRASLPPGPFGRSVRLPYQFTFNLETFRRDYKVDRRSRSRSAFSAAAIPMSSGV